MSDSVAEDIARLTPRQRDCLRLVAQGYVTKEIARQLGISDLRASKDIDGAMRKLGVSRRIEAARLLAEHEQRGVNVIPGGVVTLADGVEVEASRPRSRGGVPAQVLRESREEPGRASVQAPPDLGWPLRRRGGRGNVLNLWQRVIWIVLLTAAALIGFGTLASGIGSLSDRLSTTEQAER
ncbi:MAG TPA: helix-turn-helix transcriptional regulator [Allosphingosinicella sp.]